MTSSRSQRGLSILEATVAMVVMLIGATGLVGLNMTATRMAGDARHLTRATAIAQDLVSQIELWDYDDPRLANSVTANDGDISDLAQDFEEQTIPLIEHDEADLTDGGARWNGLPAAQLVGGYERYWNVARLAADDANGNLVPDAARIAVIVRWPQGSGFRRVALLATKPDPQEAR
jgi:Tfp pilus assembly protein PilV